MVYIPLHAFRGLSGHQSGHISPCICHCLSELGEPMQNIPMIGTKPQFITVLVTKDRGNLHPVDGDSSIGVNVEHLAKVGGDLTGFLINLAEIFRIVQSIFTDFKLNPSRITGTFVSAPTSPRPVIPRHGLNRGDSPIRQLADPAVQPGFPFNVVPVVFIGVGAKQVQQGGPVGVIVAGLDIALQGGVIGPGAMPKNPLHGHGCGALVTGALGLHTYQGRVAVRILNHSVFIAHKLIFHAGVFGNLLNFSVFPHAEIINYHRLGFNCASYTAIINHSLRFCVLFVGYPLSKFLCIDFPHVS